MQMTRPIAFWLAIAAMVAALAASGCEQATEPGPTLEPAHQALTRPDLGPGVILAEGVWALDTAQIPRMRVHGDFIAFPEPVASDLAQLRRGDVLTSDLGEGFWRAIDRVERRDDRLIVHTRPAGLGDVIVEGAFEVVVEPDADQATARRGQALRPEDRRIRGVDPVRIQTEEEVGSLDLSTDLSASARADASNANLSVDTTSGGLSLQPAVRLFFVIVDGRLYRERFRVSGWAEFDANWAIDAQDTTSLSHAVRLLPDTRHSNQLSFRLAGRLFRITPDLRLMYEASASGQGSIDVGMDGEGYVLAGYDCLVGSSCRALTPESANTPFSAIEMHQWSDGEPNASLRVALKASAQMNANGVFHGSATPLKLVYDAHADVSPPFCPFEASGTASGEAKQQGTRVRSYRYGLFDTDALFTGQNGCGISRPAQDDPDEPDDPDAPTGRPCARDSDCPSDEMCMLGTNRCIEKRPFSVTLKWSQQVDLDLKIETKTGEELSADTPAISNGELTQVSAGGADCDDCIGSCKGGTAVDCANESPSQGSCPAMCDYASEDQGSCSGTHYAPCAGLDVSACLSASTCVPDCAFSNCKCLGILIESCDGLEQSSCSQAFNCSWESDSVEWCEGGRVRCSDLDQGSCTAADACQWERPESGGAELPPFVEHAAFGPVSEGDSFRIWVSNVSGSPDETVSYTLLFRTESAHYFELRGEFEPQAASQSVFFDYEYIDQ